MEIERLSSLVREKIPFYQRLDIVRFAYFGINFRLRDDGVYYGKKSDMKKLTISDYIRILYGYFREDYSRKAFLIPPSVTYIMNCYRSFEMKNYVPRKHLRVIVLDGFLEQCSFDGVEILPIDEVIFVGDTKKKDGLVKNIVNISPHLSVLVHYYDLELKEGDAELLSKIRSLKELIFRRKPTNDRFLCSLFKEKCEFSDLTIPSALEFESLQKLEKLKYLSYSRGHNIKSENIMMLAELSRLESLEVDETDLTLDGLVFILKKMKLRSLSANYTVLNRYDGDLDEEVKKKNFSFTNRKLQELEVEGVTVNKELADLLGSSLPNLTYLNIASITLGEEVVGGFSFLLKLTNLSKLKVNGVSNELAVVLDKVGNLQTLVDIFEEEEGFVFYVNEHLRYLDIHQMFSDEQKVLLKDKAKNLYSLSIDLDWYVDDGVGAEKLLKFIQTECPTIQEFLYKEKVKVGRYRNIAWSRKFNIS